MNTAESLQSNLIQLQEEYNIKNLNFVIKDNTIGMKNLIKGGIRAIKFFEMEKEFIEKGYRGEYVIITDDNVKLTKTEGSALNYAKQFGGDVFVTRIGGEGDSLIGVCL